MEDDGVDLRAGVRIERGVEGAVGVEAGDKVAGGTGDGGEGAGDEDFAVRLQRDRGDAGVGRGREGGVERAVGSDAHQVAARRPGRIGEATTEQDASVGLGHDGADRAGQTDRRSESGAQRAVAIEPGQTVALRGDGGGIRTMEDGGDRAVGVQR